MPSVLRFLMWLLVLAGLGAAGIYALATMVEPTPREMSFPVPQERLNRDGQGQPLPPPVPAR